MYLLYLHGGGGYFSIFKVDRLFASTRITINMTISIINTINAVIGIPIINPLLSASVSSSLVATSSPLAISQNSHIQSVHIMYN